ncbi:uncharacterized protein LOC118574458 [Onychomys torridus]|uniref:uncharacterized protein LOC118574458 n=1 Tax=Onychomys torridus TaxID=38674 RepID=UPI00167F4953|nr:uncharacterized protein LOC118574458 [Onychomys torridus]
MEHGTMLKQKVSPVGEEAMGPSPKKRYTEEEDTVSHKSLEASVKVKEEVEDPEEMEHGTMLKQKVSPVGEEAMGPSPKKEYTEDEDKVSHKSLGDSVKVKEEVEDPDEMEHGTMLKQKVSPVGEEAMGPSPKKEYTEDEDTVSHKSLGASVKVKEEVEDPEEMEHGTMLKQKVSPVGEEAMGLSPKKEYTEDEDTVSHKSLGASVKVKEEVEDPEEMEHGTMLKQKVSPVGEEAMGPSPKKEYTEDEDKVSHKSLGASVKVKEEVEDPEEMEHGTMLKQKVSPVGEEAMGPSPKKEYTEDEDKVSHKSLGASVKVKEEVEDPDEMEHGTMLKQKVSPFGEAMGPSPKKEYTEDEDKVSHKSLGASVKVKEEDATDNQGAQVGMAEGDSKSPTVHLQKFDGKQLKSEAEDAVLPSPQGSLPGDALQGKEDDKVSAAGQSLSLDHSASTANASAARSLSASCFVVPLSTDDANHEIKYALMAEIRRYGRHYGRIFELLEEVQGPLEVQIQFVKFAIKEAARFKRYHLISYLDEMLDKLMSESTIRSNDLNLSA